MRNCFVPNCDWKNRNVPKRMMFHPPKDPVIFELWRHNLPKKRIFKKTDKVCEQHFQQDDIITTFDHIINGQLLKMERGRPKLKPNAVPYLNMITEDLENDSFSKEFKRKPTAAEPKQERPKLVKKKRKLDEVPPVLIDGTPEFGGVEEVLPQETAKEQPNVVINLDDEEITIIADVAEETVPNKQQDPTPMPSYLAVCEDIFEVVLPNTLWAIHREPEQHFIAFTYFDPSQMRVTKSVTVRCNGLVEVSINGQVVNAYVEKNLTVDGLTDVLNNTLSNT